MKENVRKKHFEVPSDLGHVQKTSADVLAFLEPLSLNEIDLFDIRLCLEEALINAMKYGHGLKKHLSVDLSIKVDAKKIEIVVEDKGKGFDHKNLKDCTSKSNLLKNSGRGVYLIRKLMDEVKYNEKGNCLQMVKCLK